MKTKRLLLAGVLALVITCCVLAAGCTSAPSATEDPFTGIWFSNYTDENGNPTQATLLITEDGNGLCHIVQDKGTTMTKLTWKRTSDGVYAIDYANGKSRTFTMNTEKDTITSTTGAIITKISATKDPFTGFWFSNYTTENGAQAEATLLITDDGNGLCHIAYDNGTSATELTWKRTDEGVYAITYTTGDSRTYTMNTKKDTITSTTGAVITKISATATDDASTEPIVGQWTKKYQKDGKTVDAVMTFRNDGEGYWMALGDVEGIQVISYNKNSWKKIGENTYQVIASGGAYDGKVYEEIYDPTADTLTENGSAVYTRLEPIVGIWYGSFSKGDGGKTSTLFKPDGTGLMTLSYADKGTAEVVKETWKKNADGTYEITFSNGEKRTWAIDDTGTRVTSSSGSIKQKAFLDSTFLKSIVGAWYNKDNDVSYVFNADGTGFGSWENGDVLPFTWEAKGDGIFELTYISGTWSDGTSAKGKVTKWTYDRDNDVFTSSADIEYIRPTDSIKEKITLYS